VAGWLLSVTDILKENLTDKRSRNTFVSHVLGISHKPQSLGALIKTSFILGARTFFAEMSKFYTDWAAWTSVYAFRVEARKMQSPLCLEKSKEHG
jgi:hypothetical protein